MFIIYEASVVKKYMMMDSGGRDIKGKSRFLLCYFRWYKLFSGEKRLLFGILY